jgi:hypothetical protein
MPLPDGVVSAIRDLLRAGRLDEARARLDRMAPPPDNQLRIRLHEIRAQLEHLAGNAHQERWQLEEAARLRGQ